MPEARVGDVAAPATTVLPSLVSAALLAATSAFPSTDRSVRRALAARGIKPRLLPSDGGRPALGYPTSAFTDDERAAIARTLTETATARERDTLPARSAGEATPDAVASTAERITTAWKRFDAASLTRRARAERRNGALLRCEALQAEGHSRSHALSVVAAELNTRPRSVRAWFAQTRGIAPADRVPFLVDRAGSAPRATSANERWWLQKVRDYYGDPSKRPLQKAWYVVRDIAVKEGRAVIPLRQLRRLHEKHKDHLAERYDREGAKGVHGIARKPKRITTHMHAMHTIDGDGHLLDVMVLWEDGTQKRATVFWFEDVFSGAIAGYHICKAETARDVGLAFLDVVQRHPIRRGMTVILDNTWAADSQYIAGSKSRRWSTPIKGVIEQCGARLGKTLPYNADAKPLERKHRVWLSDGVARDPRCARAYLGNNTLNKPERDGDFAPIPIAELRTIVAEHAAWYNYEDGRQTQNARGRSYGATFEASIEAQKQLGTVFKVNDRLLQRLRLWRAQVKVRGNAAVWVLGNEYQDVALLPYIGKHVVAEYPPDGATLHEGVRVYAADEDGAFIGLIRCTLPVGFDDPSAAREIMRDQRALQREAKTRARRARQQTPEEILAERPRAEPLRATRDGAVIELRPDRSSRKKRDPLAVTAEQRRAAQQEITRITSTGTG